MIASSASSGTNPVPEAGRLALTAPVVIQIVSSMQIAGLGTRGTGTCGTGTAELGHAELGQFL